MSLTSQARSAYNNSVRTGRGSEYAIFAKVTHQLKAVDKSTPYEALCRAINDNHRLWSVLADDLASDNNQLPVELRVNLLSLARFVQRHGNAILGGRGTMDVLIDINTSIMKGLRGEVEAGV